MELAVGIEAVKPAAHLFDPDSETGESGEDFAIWIAREIMRQRNKIKPERLLLLALYAWYSRRAQTVAHALVDRRWSADMAYAGALAEAQAWHESVILSLYLDESRLDP